MCQAAIRLGVTELGISDHYDLHPNETFVDYLDPDAWWQSFEVCKSRYADDLILRAGVEIGEPHLFPGEVGALITGVGALITGYPWDYVLGSLHWVDDICVFDRAFFRSDEYSTYLNYFTELERLVTAGQFDILAHFDVVKRYGFEHYGHFKPEQFEDLIRQILNSLAARECALEINTATLRRSIQTPSPDVTILEWFFEEGGRHITLGSDAHATQDVSFGLGQLRTQVRSAGYEGLTRFQQRQKRIIGFDE
jgi:histidinol-phosphatase (PHP family)